MRRRSASAIRFDRAPCPGCRAAAWRRYDGCHPRQGQDGNWPSSGSMSATIGHSAARTHRRRCSTPRAIERESIPSGIWPVTPAFCRPMRTTVTTGSIFPTANPVRSSRRCAGAMRAGSFSNLPTSPPMRGGARQQRRRSRRSHSRPSDASMGSSTSSARSTACRPPVAWLCARRGALPWSRRWKPGCAPSAPNSPGTMQSPRRSTTCSRVGRPSLAFLTMAGAASPRMVLRRGNPQPGAAAVAGALGGFSFHAATIRS